MTEGTPCESCDHVHPTTRRLHPARWICLKFPRIYGFSPVAPRKWVEIEPYMRCIGINGGACPMFSEARNPHEPNPNTESQDHGVDF